MKFFRLLFLSVFCSFPVLSIAEAKPLKFVGIDWSMTTDQMGQSLVEKGYSCELNSRKTLRTCKYGEAIVQIENTLVVFNCHSFSGCNSSLKSMARAIVDKLHIDLEYTRKAFLTIPGYCGTGSEGDRICVMEKTIRGLTFPGMKVYLNKAAYGNKPKF